MMETAICNLVLFFLLAGLTSACNQNKLSTNYNAPGVANGDQNISEPVKSKLDEKTRQALLDALADERKAEATYHAAIEKFGDVRPFSNIVNAERRHESFLMPLFEKYGVPVPENQFTAEKIEAPATLIEACKQSVEGENANIAMYDEFLEFVKQEDIREVFTYLRDASKDNHLPAFERCASGRGQGPGRGRDNP